MLSGILVTSNYYKFKGSKVVLPKTVFAMLYICKTKITHLGTTFSLSIEERSS